VRILYLAADPVPGTKGASVRIERTVRSMLALGHDVALLTPESADGQRLEGVEHEAVTLDHDNYLERMMAFRREASAWLEQQQADAVQFRGIWEGIAAAAWARQQGARVIFEVHGLPSVELPYHFPGLEENHDLLDKLIAEEHVLLDAAHLVITHSHTGRRFLLMRGVHPDRIAIVPNAVDPELFSPGPAPLEDAAPLRMVYVGTMAPWQGLPILLEGLTRFRSGPVVELHVIGQRKSVWRRQLRRDARRARVHHLVHVSGSTTQDNLVPVLRSAHLCVAPMPADGRNTLQGCCPIKLLEYMAVGRPILATRIAPIEEILVDGDTALLADPGSTAALAEGIAWALANPAEREAMGQRAREAVLARFTPELFSARLAAALDRF
jgi:glycosyltransferase involved in cell wall biosynthesis